MRHWISFFLLLSSYFLSAQETLYPDFSQLQGSFWLPRTIQNAYDLPLDQVVFEPGNETDYARDVLELSRRWFSGMIYGYGFYYQPSDEQRRIEEVFEIKPLYLVPRGDENLKYVSFYEEDGKIELQFRYFTRDYEVARLRGWRSARFPNSEGTAATLDRFDLESRQNSFDEAVKQAIRNHYRQLVPNKPQFIRGNFALFSLPRSYADGGYVHTQVRIILDTKEIQAYLVY